MPELPEVETIRRGLKDCIVNKKIVQVQVLCGKSFIGDSEKIVGKKIENIERRGKALIIKLSGEMALIIHLRMTGQLIFVSETQARFAGGHPSDSFLDDLPNTQTRVVIKLNSGELFFNDQRKFGFIKVLRADEVEKDAFIAKLAPEAWQMDDKELYGRIQKHANASIKSILLDQKNIAGLGNIYTDEALFFASLHPATKGKDITESDAKKILIGARKIMEDSISAGGSTMATYVNAKGEKGKYLEKFARVFQRQGQACLRCGNRIVKIRVAGRGTYICPNCQKEKL